MKLDLTVIKNESVNKFEKVVEKVGSRFLDMLALTLDGCVHEIDADKRLEIETALSDLLHDEFNIYKNSFTKCMNKAADLVENGLGS